MPAERTDQPLARELLERPRHRLARGAEPDTWRAHVSLGRFRTRPLIGTDAFETLALELDAEGNTRDLGVQGVVQLDEEKIHLERLQHQPRCIGLAILAYVA